MKAARAGLIKQKESIELHILSANALNNSWHLINQLPNEAVVEVLRLVRSVALGNTRAWYNLKISVCRLWRARVGCVTLMLQRVLKIVRYTIVALFHVFRASARYYNYIDPSTFDFKAS